MRSLLTSMARAFQRGPARLAAVGVITGSMALFSGQGSAQDVFWQRQVEGYFDGVNMAVFHGGLEFAKPAVADLDGDGDGDLYVGEHDGYLNVFENLGGDPPDWFCLSTALDSIDVGKHNAPTFWDIDLDGDLDLFIGEEDGNIGYFRNEGTPQEPIFTLVNPNYNAIDVGYHSIPFFRDLDTDGDDDLLIGHNEGGAALFLNLGSPGSPLWSYQTAFYAGLDVGDKSAVCSFDVDGDALPDLFMAGVEGEIIYYHNDGPPDTLPRYSNYGLIYDVGYNGAPTFWDLDSDGDLDLIAGESDGSLNLLTNIGTPTDPRWEYTQAQLAYLDLGLYSLPSLVDIDADGDLDLFVGRTQTGIAFLENTGSADSSAWEWVTGNYAGISLPGQDAPAFADLDDDGDLDMMVGCLDGTLTYYQNEGTPEVPAWSAPVYNYASVDVGDNSVPAFVDEDGDGDNDLFIGNYDGTLRHLRNDGGPVSPVWQDLGDYHDIDVGNYSRPSFADLDDDGDFDLLIGNGSLTGSITFCRNQGTPLSPWWTSESYPYQGWDFGDHASPCLGDLDGDGDADLLVGCEAGGLYFMENVGLLYDVAISLLPIDPPIVIPSQGGRFDYVLRLENSESQALPVSVWTTITMPDGNTYGPIDSLTFNLQPGVFSDLITQEITDSFPSGEYSFNGYVGLSSLLIYSSDSFPFTKQDTVGVRDPGPNPDGLTLTYYLAEPHPNPFNNRTRLEYIIPTAGRVDLALFDVCGRKVATLVEGDQPPGVHYMDVSLKGMASGVYFVRLKAGDWVGVRKVGYVR